MALLPRVLVLTTMMPVFAGCGDVAAPPHSPPETVRAEPLSSEGVSDVRLDTAVAEMRSALKFSDGAPQLYRVPGTVGFDGLRAAYDARLRGWTPEPALERHIRGGQAAAWRAGPRVFAIALLPRPLYERATDYQALVVLGPP